MSVPPTESTSVMADLTSPSYTHKKKEKSMKGYGSEKVKEGRARARTLIGRDQVRVFALPLIFIRGDRGKKEITAFL